MGFWVSGKVWSSGSGLGIPGVRWSWALVLGLGRVGVVLARRVLLPPPSSPSSSQHMLKSITILIVIASNSIVGATISSLLSTHVGVA